MAEFVSNVRKSRLVPADDLEAWLARPGIDKLPPPELAKRLVADGLLTRFQADTLLEGRHRGFVLGGQYKLLDLLARGAGRRIYVCHDLVRHQLVGLVVCHGFRGPEGSHERLKAAAAAVAGLSHPNLTRVLEVRRSGQVPLVVIEHVDGTTLHALVAKRGPLDAGRAAAYMLQAAEGLQHAHSAGFRHGSLDAHDLLVDRAGVVRVLGIGLPQSHLKPSPAADGMSTLSVDIPTGKAADLAAMGTTLTFLLTGRPGPGPLPASVPAGLKAVIEGLAGQGPTFASAVEVGDGLCPFATDPPPAPDAADLPAPMPPPPESASMAPRSAPISVPRLPTPDLAAFAPPPREIGPVSELLVTPAMIARRSPPTTTRTRRAKRGSLFAGLIVGCVLAVLAVGGVLLATTLGLFGGSTEPPTAPATKPDAPPDTPRLDDGTPLIVPEIAAAFEGMPVAVLLTVQSTGGGTHLYLNSERNYRDRANFAVVLSPTERDSLTVELGGDEKKAFAHYLNRTVLARGIVEVPGGQPRLRAASRADVAFAERFVPTEALGLVGKPAVAAFTVRSARILGDGTKGFLNSEADYKADGNFSAMLTDRCLARFREQGTEDPTAEFKDQTVEVAGVVTKDRSGRPQIEVVFPGQIRLAANPRPE